MTGLLNEIKARLEAILTGEEFEDPAGTAAAPMVRIVGLDPKRSGQQNEEDFPFVVVRPRSGSSTLSDETEMVQIIAGIYTSGDVSAGFADLDRMKELLTGLKKDRIYTPYKMNPGMEWEWGDPKTGQHPHPYYYLTINVSFKRAPQ